MNRGFDEFFGFLGGQHRYMGDNNTVLDGHTSVPETDYLTDALAERAVEFIKREHSHPFFLYLAFNAVHLPMQAADKYLSRFGQIADERRRTYAAMLSAMDDGVGKTLAALRSENLDSNTLVFFFSDNGGPTVYGGINGSSNDPLRGSKRTTWEGGIRVPFLLRWSGRIPPGKTYSQPIIQLDVFPTALAAAGIRRRSEWKLDGVNLLPFLVRNTSRSPHEVLYWRTGGMMAIRKGHWKLLRSTELGPAEEPSVLKNLSGVELYNLKDDIGETKNIALLHPKIVRELTVAWQRWNKTLAKPAWPPIPIRPTSRSGRSN
jgi:arylsulfatase A-like enzyme